MTDWDLYYPNARTEKFLDSLKLMSNKDYPTIKIYVSSASLNDNWLHKIYNFYNNEEVSYE